MEKSFRIWILSPLVPHFRPLFSLSGSLHVCVCIYFRWGELLRVGVMSKFCHSTLDGAVINFFQSYSRRYKIFFSSLIWLLFLFFSNLKNILKKSVFVYLFSQIVLPLIWRKTPELTACPSESVVESTG